MFERRSLCTSGYKWPVSLICWYPSFLSIDSESLSNVAKFLGNFLCYVQEKHLLKLFQKLFVIEIINCKIYDDNELSLLLKQKPQNILIDNDIGKYSTDS